MYRFEINQQLNNLIRLRDQIFRSNKSLAIRATLTSKWIKQAKHKNKRRITASNKFRNEGCLYRQAILTGVQNHENS